VDGKHSATGSRTGDTWAPGSGTGPPLPLPPPAPVRGPVIAPAGTPPESDAGPKGWRKFFAIAGIVTGFTVLLTIPGWIALNTYREWKRGQRGEPKLLIGWGVIASLLYSLAFIGVATGVLHTPNSPSSARPRVPDLPAPTGFRAASGADGWTVYTSDAEGFSIALPEGWHPYIAKDGSPSLKFSGAPYDPLHVPATLRDSASLAVARFRVPTFGPQTPRRYYELQRFVVASDPNTVGEVEMTRARLPAGETYLLQWVQQRKVGGARSWMMYGVLHGTSDYELVFAVPTADVDSYRPVFQEIAATFTLVE
jgi:hypothetical protein